MAAQEKVSWFDPDPDDIAGRAKPNFLALMAIRNGTRARLIIQHKAPNTSPTPGADYGDKTQADRDKAFQESHDHAISQWQAYKGAVGPTGSEGGLPYSVYNDPDKTAYESNQQFAYQHDMQATDADLQANTPERRKAYEKANRKSAVEGMFVLLGGGTNEEAMAKTQKVWGDADFKVGTNYSK
jgi:hypothetical protein